jgi:hypothetical protein
MRQERRDHSSRRVKAGSKDPCKRKVQGVATSAPVIKPRQQQVQVQGAEQQQVQGAEQPLP